MKQNFTMRQGALDGIEAFLAVALHRSFRRAAAELGVTPSAVSQAIRTLEARIGATLFQRTTRSVGLTEAGERFLARAKPAFEELVAASRVARDLGQRPSGLLRLTAPRAALPLLVTPLIASFSRVCPEVEVELVADPLRGLPAGEPAAEAAEPVEARLEHPLPESRPCLVDEATGRRRARLHERERTRHTPLVGILTHRHGQQAESEEHQQDAEQEDHVRPSP